MRLLNKDGTIWFPDVKSYDPEIDTSDYEHVEHDLVEFDGDQRYQHKADSRIVLIFPMAWGGGRSDPAYWIYRPVDERNPLFFDYKWPKLRFDTIEKIREFLA